MSEASLMHHENYQCRVEVTYFCYTFLKLMLNLNVMNVPQVLKMLGYIDDNCTVKLKGRVACEMGSQELIITELVLNNVLTDRYD